MVFFVDPTQSGAVAVPVLLMICKQLVSLTGMRHKLLAWLRQTIEISKQRPSPPHKRTHTVYGNPLNALNLEAQSTGKLTGVSKTDPITMDCRAKFIGLTYYFWFLLESFSIQFRSHTVMMQYVGNHVTCCFKLTATANILKKG